MFVSDLRHFLDMPEDAPGPARRMVDHLSTIVRAATATKAGAAWASALPCQRRPGNRRCRGRILVFRADLPAPIEWRCSSCGDEGVISGWEDSPFDLRRAREPVVVAERDLVVTDEGAATLRSIQVLDTDSERVVFSARSVDDSVVLSGTQDDLEELAGYIAAEANHETDRRRRKRLDVAFEMVNQALEGGANPTAAATGVRNPLGSRADGGEPRSVSARDVSGRWRIVQMDLWDRDALDLVEPAFIEFKADRTGSFGFIAVSGWMDCRPATIDGRFGVEFSFQGWDEGDEVTGRGWAAPVDEGMLEGHIYFHMGDHSGFRAVQLRNAAGPVARRRR